ncbi:MAG TPA: VOC family protein [Candidatus Caccoplasma merdavium]|nr:VOC family protein [Candidatus Caccoplasma merdavium]
MKIEHLAIWVGDLERLRRFYMKYFDAECGEMYVNDVKKFSSYFLTFGKNGARITLIHMSNTE